MFMKDFVEKVNFEKSQQATKITQHTPVFSAQHISQPPDVTNNAKSSRQADRVGRGVPSVRVAGNVGMDSDCKFIVLFNPLFIDRYFCHG